MRDLATGSVSIWRHHRFLPDKRDLATTTPDPLPIPEARHAVDVNRMNRRQLLPRGELVHSPDPSSFAVESYGRQRRVGI